MFRDRVVLYGEVGKVIHSAKISVVWGKGQGKAPKLSGSVTWDYMVGSNLKREADISAFPIDGDKARINRVVSE